MISFIKIIASSVVLFYSSLSILSYCQVNGNKSRGEIRIMFYNVENLFDTINNPHTQDNDFTPTGNLKWTDYKLNKKLNNIYKVIAAAGENEPPEIVTFAEVENREVIEKLIYNTPLSKFNYAIVHQESPDERGIDVALIYRPDKIKKISAGFINIIFTDNSKDKTRDILYFSFCSTKKDTVHLFVNHWPSRSGGQLASEQKRMFVAGILKSKTDSIFYLNRNSNIIITGDFNDNPIDRSLSQALKVQKPVEIALAGELYNLTIFNPSDNKYGTIKYRGVWHVFDQMIVSGNLLNKGGLYSEQQLLKIFSADFLLEPDGKYLGKRPFRTYNGYKYIGGFSDHLPIILDLNMN